MKDQHPFYIEQMLMYGWFCIDKVDALVTFDLHLIDKK